MTITADALLTQRKFARYLVKDRHAHYHFTVKGNQPTLLEDIQTLFANRGKADAILIDAGHGRVEVRRIWVSKALNDYLDFPFVAQVFMIERESFDKKTKETSIETAYGLTSQADHEAGPKQILKTNRGHWCIENGHHYVVDWNYNEDRCRIRTQHGPENISRLRRFAVSVIKMVSNKGVAEAMRDLVMNVRLVFDYLRMTGNTIRAFRA